MPALSLILCSRNDCYMGNSKWRLETTLNFVAERVAEIGHLDDVEIVVADWGSEVPLREVLRLTPAAARIVSFLHVPLDIAIPLQKDSPFPEVLALNAAARRARGAFVGRIDQDTLVGKRFLETFFDLYEGRRELDTPIQSALFFANLRMVPYRFAVRCPPLPIVERFVAQFGDRLKVEVTKNRPFWCHGVGIWLLPKAIWEECGGYDEDMLYMNAMEIKMIHRLLRRYTMVDLGEIVGYDFYHLEHYHPWVPRQSRVYRKENPVWVEDQLAFNPNGTSWGLAEHTLTLDRAWPTKSARSHARRFDGFALLIRYAFLKILAGVQIAWDSLIVRSMALKQRFCPDPQHIPPGVPE